jgi:hypothetical protein
VLASDQKVFALQYCPVCERYAVSDDFQGWNSDHGVCGTCCDYLVEEKGETIDMASVSPACTSQGKHGRSRARHLQDRLARHCDAPATTPFMQADTVKCITIRQPWASLIVAGIKDIECRTWATSHRGLLYIHAAAARPDGDGWEEFLGEEPPPGRLPAWADLPRGVILGSVQLVDCVAAADAPAEVLASLWAADEGWLWLLRDPRPLRRPVPCRGALGLWQLPASLRLP